MCIGTPKREHFRPDRYILQFKKTPVATEERAEPSTVVERKTRPKENGWHQQSASVFPLPFYTLMIFPLMTSHIVQSGIFIAANITCPPYSGKLCFLGPNGVLSPDVAPFLLFVSTFVPRAVFLGALLVLQYMLSKTQPRISLARSNLGAKEHMDLQRWYGIGLTRCRPSLVPCICNLSNCRLAVFVSLLLYLGREGLLQAAGVADGFDLQRMQHL